MHIILIVVLGLWRRVWHQVPLLCRGITATALGPFGDPLVMGTTKGGLFSVNMASTSYSVTKCAKLEESISDVCWNMGTGEVFAASAASVVVVRQN